MTGWKPEHHEQLEKERVIREEKEAEERYQRTKATQPTKPLPPTPQTPVYKEDEVAEKEAEARYQRQVQIAEEQKGEKDAKAQAENAARVKAESNQITPSADNPYPIQREIVPPIPPPIWPQDGAPVPTAGAKAGLREVSTGEAAYMASFDETRRLLKEMRKDPLLTEQDRVAAATMNDIMREGEEGRLKGLTHPHFEVTKVIWEWLGVMGKR